MVWEERLRRISWVFFLLMWIPLGVVVYSAVTEAEDPPVEALAAVFLFVILFAVLQIGSFGIGWLEKEKIRKKGIPAKATILSVTDTGTMVNNQPLLKIGLEVQPPYDSRFVATVEYIVPYSFLPQVQPGNTLQVFYLEDTKEVAIADL
jgi:hypothetical protein